MKHFLCKVIQIMNVVFSTHNTVKTFKKHYEHENQNFKMWVDRNNATKCVCVSSFIFSLHKRKTARNTNTTCLF